MVTITRFVGLDYRQDNVQVCVMNPQGKLLTDRSVHNNWKAIRTVVQNTLPTDESGSVVVRASIRKPSEGKPRNAVIAAVANRWIRKLYRQMQPDQLVVA